MKIILTNVSIENKVPAEWNLIKTVSSTLSTTGSATTIDDIGITKKGVYKFVVTVDTRHYLIRLRIAQNQVLVCNFGNGNGQWFEANTPVTAYAEFDQTLLDKLLASKMAIVGATAASTTVNYEIKVYEGLL